MKNTIRKSSALALLFSFTLTITAVPAFAQSEEEKPSVRIDCKAPEIERTFAHLAMVKHEAEVFQKLFEDQLKDQEMYYGYIRTRSNIAMGVAGVAGVFLVGVFAAKYMGVGLAGSSGIANTAIYLLPGMLALGFGSSAQAEEAPTDQPAKDYLVDEITPSKVEVAVVDFFEKIHSVHSGISKGAEEAIQEIPYTWSFFNRYQKLATLIAVQEKTSRVQLYKKEIELVAQTKSKLEQVCKAGK